VVGKTIAELGWGSASVDMVTFGAGQGPVMLLTNSHKSADLTFCGGTGSPLADNRRSHAEKDSATIGNLKWRVTK